MKSKATSSLSYTGTVTLSQYIDNKKVNIATIHNTGNEPLFNFLADCLAGNFKTASAAIPTKLMLLKIATDDFGGLNLKEITNATAAGPIGLLTKPEKIDYNTVRYSFMIPRDQLASISFNAIGLYADTDNIANYAAICKANSTTNNISASSVLVVDWDLTVSNR